MPTQVQRRHSLQHRSFSNHVTTKRVPRMEPTHIQQKQALPPCTLSPFNTLPVELQAEIFSHCLSPFPTFHVDEPPLSIARVCHGWSSLVFNTPKLWSSFEIQVTGSGTTLSLGHLHTVKRWLHRSKQCPLSIRVTHNPVARFPDSDSRSRQLLALLISDAHRWKHIELGIPSSNFSTLQHTLPDTFPALQSLALRLKNFWGSGLPVDLSLSYIPWRQMTCIDLQFQHPNLIDLDECLDILSQTERLKECTLKAECTMDLLNVQHDASISLPLLDSFTLNLHGGIKTRTDGPEACLIKFLNKLSVPKLQNLHLEWLVPQNQESGLWTAHHSDFTAFIRGFAGTLRHLSFRYLPLSDEELQECLSHLARVTHLTLKYPLNDIYDDLVTSGLLSSCTFEPSDDRNTHSMASRDRPLLPVLEHFDIEGHGRGYTSADLVTFINSRPRGKSRQGGDASVQLCGVMQSCRIFSMNVVSDEVEDYVRQWKMDGMEISIQNLIIR